LEAPLIEARPRLLRKGRGRKILLLFPPYSSSNPMPLFCICLPIFESSGEVMNFSFKKLFFEHSFQAGNSNGEFLLLEAMA